MEWERAHSLALQCEYIKKSRNKNNQREKKKNNNRTHVRKLNQQTERPRPL